MERLHIVGRRPLAGEVAVSGSKNAALALLAASLLSETPVRIAGMPRLGDVETMRRLLQQLGAAVTVDSHHLWHIDPSAADRHQPSESLVRQTRASICLLGPLLATQGRGVIALPGGCNLGHRPVDLHLRGLRALGAHIRFEHGQIVAEAVRLRGTRINLSGPHGPTVTGTCNLLCAAVKAEGQTILDGAAREPEVVAVGRFLQGMGAKIAGLGGSRLVIEGGQRLAFPGDIEAYRAPPDRIEAATLLMAAAAGGDGSAAVTIRGTAADDLSAVLAALRSAGHSLTVAPNTITIKARRRCKPICLTARPFPGLPTDLQPLLLALAAAGDGESRIRDAVFPYRWMHVTELARLGARIRLEADTAIAQGAPLQGARVVATDLRAAAALVVAALAAEGETIVESLTHLDRGYERLDAKLASLGADIERRRHGALPADYPSSPRNNGCPSTLRPEVMGPRSASSRRML